MLRILRIHKNYIKCKRKKRQKIILASTQRLTFPCWLAAILMQPVWSFLALRNFWKCKCSANSPYSFLISAEAEMLITLLQCRCFLFCLCFSYVSCPAAVWVFPTASSSPHLLCSFLLLYLCWKCLSTALSTTVKLLWKRLKILPWHIWVIALWISWITYACNITGLCCLWLILGYRFSQKQINYFCGLCSSNLAFGVT